MLDFNEGIESRLVEKQRGETSPPLTAVYEEDDQGARLRWFSDGQEVSSASNRRQLFALFGEVGAPPGSR